MRSGTTRRRAIVLAIALVTLPATMAAQVWSVDTSAGKSNYNIAPISAASSMGMVGIHFTNDHRFFQTSVGIPFSSQDLTWEVAEFADRYAMHRAGLTAGIDPAILIHNQRDPVTSTSGRGVMVEFLPMISHNVGAAVLELRSGPRWYGERIGGSNWTRPLWSSDFSARVRPESRFQLEGSVRHDRTSNEDYTLVSGAAIGVVGRMVFRGSAGQWLHDPNDGGVEWGASMGISIRHNIWITATAGHDSFDPTFLSPPRTNWSAGLSFQLGSKQESQRRANEFHDNARVVLRIPVRDAARAPSVAGDFTNWKPVGMDRYDHEWRFSTKLPPGVYHFAFRAEDGSWFVPADTPNRIQDGMGGWQAVLVVR